MNSCTPRTVFEFTHKTVADNEAALERDFACKGLQVYRIENKGGFMNNTTAEIIIFIGIPASGKSTFYEQYFAATHIHISLDILHTRNQENRMLEKTLTSGKSCVIDNTNVTAAERAKYIEAGKRYEYKVIGYYFRSSIDECRIRNDRRHGRKQVPEVAMRNKAAHLERPSMQEGFDELYYVKIVDDKFETTQYNEA